jgi:hypothetical protein
LISLAGGLHHLHFSFGQLAAEGEKLFELYFFLSFHGSNNLEKGLIFNFYVAVILMSFKGCVPSNLRI